MNEQKMHALQFLKDRALDAHQGGDIGTVRHLAGMAIQAIHQDTGGQWQLADIAWAITYSLYWIKDPDEAVFLQENVYNGLAEKSGPYKALFDFLFQVISPMREDDPTSVDLKQVNPAELDSATRGTVEEDTLLLTLVLEICWWPDEQYDDWKAVWKTWEACLPEGSTLRQRIGSTMDRILLQNQILLGRGDLTPGDNHRFQRITRQMAQAWQHFYRREWALLDRLIPELKESAPYASDYFLAVQALINWTRFQRRSDFTGSAEGVLRYERASMNRQAVAIQNARLALLNEMLDNVRKTSNATGPLRFRLYRLAMLTELAALRVWDLQTVLAVRERIRDFQLDVGTFDWFRYGRPSSNPDFLVAGIVSWVRSLNPGESTELMQQAIHLLEVDENPGPSLTRLAQELLSRAPIEWPYVVDVLRTAGDAFPEGCLRELARWSASFAALSTGPAFRFQATPLDFWTPILTHCNIPAEVWTDLTPLIAAEVRHPHKWHLEHELLQVFLAKAPEGPANSVLDAMMVVTDASHEPVRQAVLFNSALENRHLRQKVLDYLSLLTRMYPNESSYRLNRDLLVKEERPDNTITTHHSDLVLRFQEWCEQLKGERQFIIGDERWSQFRRLSWQSVPHEETDSVLSIAERTLTQKQLAEDDASAIITALIGIAYTATDGVRDRLGELLARLLQVPPNLIPLALIESGPFSNFSMQTNLRSPYEHRLIALASLVYPYTQPSAQKEIRTWSLQRVLSTEHANLGHLVRLFLYAFLTDEGKNDGFAGLMAAAGRIHNGTMAAEALQVVIVILSESGPWKERGVERLYTADKYGLFMSILADWLALAAHAPDPTARLSAATLLGRHVPLLSRIPNAQTISGRLMRDPRASVRNALNQIDSV